MVGLQIVQVGPFRGAMALVVQSKDITDANAVALREETEKLCMKYNIVGPKKIFMIQVSKEDFCPDIFDFIKVLQNEGFFVVAVSYDGNNMPLWLSAANSVMAFVRNIAWAQFPCNAIIFDPAEDLKEPQLREYHNRCQLYAVGPYAKQLQVKSERMWFLGD